MRSNLKLFGLTAVAICLFGCLVAANNMRADQGAVDIVGKACIVKLTSPGSSEIMGIVVSANSSFIELKVGPVGEGTETTYYVWPLQSIAQIKYTYSPGNAK